MNNDTTFWLALLGQTGLIVGCYIYASRQIQQLNQHWERIFAEHKRADSETHTLLFELIRAVTANHAYTKGRVDSKRSE